MRANFEITGDYYVICSSTSDARASMRKLSMLHRESKLAPMASSVRISRVRCGRTFCAIFFFRVPAEHWHGCAVGIFGKGPTDCEAQSVVACIDGAAVPCDIEKRSAPHELLSLCDEGGQDVWAGLERLGHRMSGHNHKRGSCAHLQQLICFPAVSQICVNKNTTAKRRA